MYIILICKKGKYHQSTQLLAAARSYSSGSSTLSSSNWRAIAAPTTAKCAKWWRDDPSAMTSAVRGVSRRNSSCALSKYPSTPRMLDGLRILSMFCFSICMSGTGRSAWTKRVSASSALMPKLIEWSAESLLPKIFPDAIANGRCVPLKIGYASSAHLCPRSSKRKLAIARLRYAAFTSDKSSRGKAGWLGLQKV